jgi:hypothetical protein
LAHALETVLPWSRAQGQGCDNDLHTIMYMPIEPSESIEAFMIHGKNKIIESFIQHLLGDSLT